MKEESPDNRRAERRDVVIRAELREPGHTRVTVQVEDLSRTGFRCETWHMLAIGARVFLHLPSFQGLEAYVAWKHAPRYGFRFLHPLHVAVFEAVAARFPPGGADG